MKKQLINTDYLLQKLLEVSTKLGRVTLRPALSLYCVMRNPATPSKDKWAIALALAYLILPIDILSAKRLPIIGWLDEIASLMILFNKMKKRITADIEIKVEKILDRWLPEYVQYEVIEEK